MNHITILHTITNAKVLSFGEDLGEVKVYPNPAKKQFTIEFNDVINSNALIEIYGNMGNLVHSEFMQSGVYIQNINVSQLKDGLYYYRIIMNDSNISSGKLIILNK